MKKTMKSMVMAATVMAMAVTANAKTWTNFVGFGFAVPTDTVVDVEKKNSNIKNENICVTNQYGLSGMYMGVHESGFAVRGLLDFYRCDMNNEVKGYDYTNLGMDAMAGVGYAPVHNDSFTLGVFGMLGFTGACGASEREKSEGLDYESKYTHTYAATEFGVNVTAVYTPSRTFSFWGSVTGTCVAAGTYNWKGEHFSDNVKDDDVNYDTKGDFRVIPAAGVCWKF